MRPDSRDSLRPFLGLGAYKENPFFSFFFGRGMYMGVDIRVHCKTESLPSEMRPDNQQILIDLRKLRFPGA